METKYQEANPYGELSIKTLEGFEQVIQYRLPEDYRKYLINFNGAEPIILQPNIQVLTREL